MRLHVQHELSPHLIYPIFTFRFSVDSKGNEVVTVGSADTDSAAGSHGSSHDGGIDEFFWCAQVRNLSNLVSLNLNLVTTDEMLLLLGDACPKLEIVNIVSRITQVKLFQVSVFTQQKKILIYSGHPA